MPDRSPSSTATPIPVRYTAPQAAALLGMHVKTLHRHRIEGLIGYQLGGSALRPRIYFTQADLTAYVASLTRGATASR